MILLQVSGLAKSVYYYTLSKIDKDDKNKERINLELTQNDIAKILDIKEVLVLLGNVVVTLYPLNNCINWQITLTNQ